MKPRLVLGIGNILMKDEAVGVRVAEALAKMPLPDDVEAADGGTFGADLIDLLADREEVIVVDAVESDRAPGTVLRYTYEEFAAQPAAAMSLHEVGVLETLRMTAQLGCAPRKVTVFGIVPEVVRMELGMTERMSALVPKVARIVLAELQRTTAPEPRRDAAPSDPLLSAGALKTA